MWFLPKKKKNKKREPNFEFVSPLPPEACLDRLNLLTGHKNTARVRTHVEHSVTDDDLVLFQVSRSFLTLGARFRRTKHRVYRRNYVKIRIAGKLRQLDASESTLITTTSHIHAKTYIFNGLWWLCFAPALAIASVASILNQMMLPSFLYIGGFLALTYLFIYQPTLLADEYLTELMGEISTVLKQRNSDSQVVSDAGYRTTSSQ